MSEWISPERLSQLISLIYDCAIDPTRWPIALEAVRVEIGAANAALDLLALPHGAHLLQTSVNIAPPYRDTRADYGGDVLRMWGGPESMQRLPIDEPRNLLSITPDVASLGLPIYEEWARPQGILDVMGVFLARDAETFGTVGFGRLERDGPYGEREMHLATLLTPHLQRAAAINRLLDIAALERSTFAALFDALSAPVFLVGRGGRLVHVNQSGQGLLDAGDVLRAHGGVLLAREPAGNRALASAIAEATLNPDQLGRKGLGIPLRRPNGEVGALHVLPLARNVLPGRADRLAAVFVARSLSPLVAPPLIFSALFGLTPGESRVFDHIVAGRTVAQTADALGLEDSTVKTHLLRVYDKTGVRRQAELVRMAASLSVPAGTPH